MTVHKRLTYILASAMFIGAISLIRTRALSQDAGGDPSVQQETDDVSAPGNFSGDGGDSSGTAREPTEIVETSRTNKIFPDADHPATYGHETDCNMEVHDNQTPKGKYADGKPSEVFKNIDPAGFKVNNGKPSTWAQGSNFVDYMSTTATVDPGYAADKVIVKFDQEWHDTRQVNPADSHDFTLNTDSVEKRWHDMLRNGHGS